MDLTMDSLLVSILKDEKIGNIGLGDSKHKVITEFGPPEYWEGFKEFEFLRSDVWRYARVSIVFENEIVVSISFSFTDYGDYDRNYIDTVAIDLSEQSRRLSSFVSLLESQKVAFEVLNDHLGRPMLQIGKHVLIYFTKSRSEATEGSSEISSKEFTILRFQIFAAEKHAIGKRFGKKASPT
ncbi:MAG: hypothetical protein ABL888_21770 [Pirellulaceae bacterium]